MNEQGVTYTVKELLAIQNVTLDRIERKVDAAAIEQAQAIAKLDLRVSLLEARPELEPRVRSLEDARSESYGERDYRRFLWPTCAAFLAFGVGLVPYLFHLY